MKSNDLGKEEKILRDYYEKDFKKESKNIFIKSINYEKSSFSFLSVKFISTFMVLFLVGVVLFKNGYMGITSKYEKIPEAETTNFLSVYLDNNEVYDFYSDAVYNTKSVEIDSNNEIEDVVDFYISL